MVHALQSQCMGAHSKGEKMSKQLTDSEYYAEISSIVDEAIAAAREFKMDAEEFDRYIWETIDGHEWVIYTGYHYDVLARSENDGYAADNWGADSIIENGELQTARMAFGAMYADVMQEIGNRDDFDPSNPSDVQED